MNNMAIIKKDILEVIDNRIAIAKKNYEDNRKIAPNAYWTWVEWGELNALELIKEEIELLEDI